jgi:hypothetical protein
VDRQKGRLAAHNEIQSHLLSRFLETTKQQAMEHGLARWELLPPTRSAAEEWRRTLSDATLICGKQIQLLQHILRVEEPLFLNHLAYVVKDCLSGDQTGIWLRLRPRRLEPMQAWGSTLLE